MVEAVIAWLAKMAGSAGWRQVEGWLGRMGSGPIRITSPGEGQGLTGKVPDGESFTYLVRGKLKRLPKDSSIWLLVEDERTHCLWPQGAERVAPTDGEGSWTGRIHVGVGYSRVKILAVIAPPTSTDFFEYACANGTKTGWSPLTRLPPECKNVHPVTALVP